jgi:hypothetical protein
MASRIEPTRRSWTRRARVALVAFTTATALVAWLIVAGSPAPSPLAPFFTTMVSSSSIC